MVPALRRFVRDLLVSGWIGALTGAAYAGWFSLGATFFRRGVGRFVPLAVDLLLGGSAGVIGALLPRGNAVNLLGGPSPLGLGQPASAALLRRAPLRPHARRGGSLQGIARGPGPRGSARLAPTGCLTFTVMA